MSRQTPSLSFEVFPPNPAVGNDNIISALQDMQELAPHFISVTASNNKFNIKETTVRLADFIQNDLAIPTIAHLPATGALIGTPPAIRARVPAQIEA